MNFWITIVLVMASFVLSAQTQMQKDSVVNEICKTLHATSELNDSVRVVNAFAAHVNKFADRFSESPRMELLEGIFLRAQRLCPQLRVLLAQVSPPAGDWKRVIEKPVVKASKKQCRGFLKHERYSYLESDGVNSVSVEINKGVWMERFSDGSYSKLNLRWTNDCEFDLEFVESNNALRKSMSQAGDKYHYVVLEKAGDYYAMLFELDGIYSTFKVYVK
jgi:hypothetical protein